MFLRECGQSLHLIRSRRAAECFPEGPDNPLGRFSAPFFDHARGEDACCFNISGIVEQCQRLLRDVRSHTLRDAFFAAWRVEREKARMEIGTLPVSVKAAAPLVLTHFI